MKKSYLFLAATAILALASCSENTYLGENEENAKGTETISFGSGFKALTRGNKEGYEAAKLLGEKFYVGGYKYDGTASKYVTVFDNYFVQWDDNTAGTTTDNTSDWMYVGLTPLGFTGHITTGTQTIKYWDHAASYYDFVAYSPGEGNSIIITGTPSDNQILATAIDQNNLTTAAYTLQGSATDLTECYIADLITAKQSEATKPDINYRDEVSIIFRRLGSKVRLALYETIPGYSINDVKFYSVATGGTSSATPTLFASSNVFYPSGTMTVKFPTIGSTNRAQTDYNKAHVTFAGSGTATSTKTFTALGYETDNTKWEDTRLNYTGNTNTYLKRTSTNPSFAGDYISVLPDETGNVLELRVDYTLESIDGSKETITVHGATAFIPQIYAAWKPNYAYTYIFKISDNTNGLTNTEIDKSGLYPITFDAVVADSEDGTQSTITTVASPSITTYMKGHDYEHDGPEYKVSSDSIYIQVMNGTTLANDLNSKGKLYSVTGAGVDDVMSEANVMDALNIRTSDIEGTIVGRNGFTLTPVSTAQLATGDATFGTIPGADGNNIKSIAANTAVRFPASAGAYAYVYDYTTGTPSTDEIHTAVELSEAPSNWATTYTTYYTNEACTATAPATFPTLGTGEKVTYYQKYTNLNRTYGVKVIRVK